MTNAELRARECVSYIEATHWQRFWRRIARPDNEWTAQFEGFETVNIIARAIQAAIDDDRRNGERAP